MSYPAEFVAGAQLPAADLNDYLFNTEYTYGETIAAGLAVYLKSSDGKIYKTTMASLEAANNFVGFTKEAGVLNDVKHIYQPGQKVVGLSALTAGSMYFLNETAGTISTIPGVYPVEVGIATSTTELLIYPKRVVTDYRYGDGSDGTINFDGSTDANTVSTRSGSTYTLTKDVYADIINMSGAGTIIDTAGYKVYSQRGIFRLSTSTAKFRNNGGNGGNGGNATAPGAGGTGGTAGAAAGSATLPAPGAPAAGGAGSYITSSGTGAGSNGSNGGSVTDSIIAGSTLSSGAGGSGVSGSGTGAGGSAGTSATNTQTKAVPRNYVAATTLMSPNGTTLTILRPGCSGPGGGGGGTSQTNNGQLGGGGGGGAGASAGIIQVSTLAIVDLGSGTMFEAIGGNGGNGGNAALSGLANQAAGGGGAGPGGHGGVIIRIYRYLSGSATTAVTGGTKGTVGTGAVNGTGTTGNNGGAASDGAAGLVIDIII